jgi:hypothetical protein
VIAGGKMQSWTQEQPCRILKFSARYPSNYALDFAAFVPRKSKETLHEAEGETDYVYSDWTLPRNGCAWILRKKTE